MEQALVNTVITFKLMQYSYSLKCFFKDEFKKNGVYVIPFSHILHIKRKIFPLIRDACDYVCPYEKQCDGHHDDDARYLLPPTHTCPCRGPVKSM